MLCSSSSEDVSSQQAHIAGQAKSNIWQRQCKNEREGSSQAHRVHTAEEISCAFSSCLPGLQHISHPLIPFVSKNGKSTRALRPVLKNVSVVRSVDSGRKGNNTLCDDTRSKMRSVVAKKLKKINACARGPGLSPGKTTIFKTSTRSLQCIICRTADRRGPLPLAPCTVAFWVHDAMVGQDFSSSQLRHYQTIRVPAHRPKHPCQQMYLTSPSPPTELISSRVGSRGIELVELLHACLVIALIA